MINNIIINTFALSLQYGLAFIIPMFLTPHFIKCLGLSNYGFLSISFTIGSYFSFIVQYSFQLTGPQRIAQVPESENGIVMERITCAKFILLAALSPIILLVSILIWRHDFPPACIALLCVPPIASAFHSIWYLQAVNRFTLIAIFSIIGSSASLLLGFTLVDGDSTVSLLAASASLSIGIALASILSFLATKSYAILHQFIRHRNTVIKELQFGLPLFLSQIVSLSYSASGTIIVGSLAGIREAGAFNAVERVFGALLGGCLLIHTAAYPKLAKLYISDSFRYKKLIRHIAILYLSATMVISVSALLFMDKINNFIFGNEYHSSGNGLFAWGLIWFLFGGWGTILTGYYTVSGNVRKILPLTIKILVLTFIIGIPFTIYFGAIGWMASFAISQSVVIAESIRELLRIGKMRISSH